MFAAPVLHDHVHANVYGLSETRAEALTKVMGVQGQGVSSALNLRYDSPQHTCNDSLPTEVAELVKSR